MSPNPPTDAITWTHVAPLAQWTVAIVAAALTAFEDGDIGEAAALADAMLRDPQIAADLSGRVRKLASRSALPFFVEPSDEGDGRKRGSVAERTKALWWRTHPESTIAAIDRDAIMLGVALGWIEWVRTSTEWTPILHHLPAHGLRYDDSDKTWRYQGGDGVEHVVTPGDGKWFLHLPHGSRSWLMGAIRPLGIPFALDPLVLRAFATFVQRNGLPTLAVEEPHHATDDVENQSGATAGSDSAKQFYQDVNKGMRGGILRLKQPADRDQPAWKAYWLELQGKTWASFADLLLELRRRKGLALTGRDSEKNTSLGGDGELGARVVNVEYLASDAETLTTSLRDQVWKPFSRFNYGDPDLAAWGRWDTRPPPDLAVRAGTLKTGSEAIAGLEAQGVDTDPVVAELGLKRRPGWKPRDPSQLPPPSPAPAEANPEAA